jgi:AraC-like DNA-binding protein
VSKNSAFDVQHQASWVIRAPARKKCLSGGKALWAKVMRAQQAPNRPAHAAIAIDDCNESREANHLRSGRRSSSNRRVARSSASASCVSASLRSRTTKLASESLTFASVLADLRVDLAKRQLRDGSLAISQIAWLLGYREVSAFTHAFKRWTGKTPREVRTAA